MILSQFFFFQAEDGIRDRNVTGVQTCALPISQHVLAVGQRAPERHGRRLNPVSASKYRSSRRGTANSCVAPSGMATALVPGSFAMTVASGVALSVTAPYT